MPILFAAFAFAAFSRCLLTDDSRLSTFLDLRFELDFLDDDDRSDNRLRSFVDLDSRSDLEVRNVNRMLRCKAL